MSSKKLTYDIFLEATARGIERGMARGGEAARKMSRNISGSAREANQALGRMISTAGKVGVAFGAAGAAAGVYAFTRVMGEAVRLAGIQEKAEAKLGAVLKATGEAAGYNLEQLKAMAGEMQDLTGVGDEVILNGMAMLATFKNVAGDGFKRATMAALDMSQVLDQDLKTSFIQIGKALNDPIAGMSALSKAGVQFTEQQKEMARALVESGDLLGAQEIILQELGSQFGGAAAANLETFGGRLDAAKGRLSDLKEEIGFAVTKNEFFIEVLKLAEQQLKEWTESIKGNRAATMQYAKDGALAMIEFGQAMITAADIAIRSGNLITGSFRTAAASALWLYGAIMKVGDAYAKVFPHSAGGLFFGRLVDAKEQAEAAFAAADKLYEQALEDFNRLAEGSEALGQASIQLDKLKKTMEGIDAGEVKEAADQAEKAADQIQKIGGTWINTSRAAMDAAADDVEYAAKAMSGDVDALGVDWGRVWATMEKESIDAVNRVEDRLKDLTSKRREVTIYVKEVVQKAMGGLINGYARGGRLSGYGGGDRIPALLEAGEFIIRKEAVARFGAGLFAALNSLQLPKFQTGGMVGAGAGSGGESITVNFNLPGSGAAVSGQFRKTDARELLRQLKEMDRLRSS